MITIGTILLPTDGSECSAKAMTYALSLAKQYGGRVIALHVIDRGWEEQTRNAVVEVGHDLMRTLHDGYARTAHTILQAVVDAGAKAAVPVEARLAHGTPYEEIVKASREVGADLIVIGTHGRTGMSHFLLGSVAEKVVRTGGCPVLTVQLQERDFVKS